MLFDLLLASITTLLCFAFLFLVVFNSFFMIPTEIENARLKLPLIIPIGAPVTVANDTIEMLQLTTLQTKRLKTYQKTQKKQYIC